MNDNQDPSQPPEDKEIWRAILSYPGYEVSNHGQVKSYWRIGRRPICLSDEPQRILRPYSNTKGYSVVRLRGNGKKKTLTVHRLVLFAFVGPCPPGMEACHADGKRTNNYLSNLRWDTHSGNGKDARRHDSQKGMKNPSAKLTDAQVIQIRELSFQGCCYREIGEMFDMCSVNISDIVRRHTWTHI